MQPWGEQKQEASARGSVVYDMDFSRDGDWITFSSGKKVLMHSLRRSGENASIRGAEFKQLETRVSASPMPVSVDDRFLAVRQSPDKTMILDSSGLDVLRKGVRDAVDHAFATR